MTGATCPFCSPDPTRVFYRDKLVIGLWDAFPVSPGHALLVPVRHVPTWFEATPEEKSALTRAIEIARSAIESGHSVAGYNIGINNGEAAGQTIFHLHVHLIPRVPGDVPDPRGGVRHVIPAKANYIANVPNPSDFGLERHPLVAGGLDDPLLPHLKHHLALAKAADIVVAFTLRSGLQLLQAHLQDLLDRGGKLRILTGDYLGITDPDALLRLLDLNGQVDCRIFQTEGLSDSFHPKAYLFHHRDDTASAFIGSSNLSKSALAEGVEWNYRVTQPSDVPGWKSITAAFEALFMARNTVPLTPDWIAAYRARRTVDLRKSIPEIAPDSPVKVPTPHVIQQEALAALAQTREQGHRAALVVLATGLGKTWLSAFDSAKFNKVLFVAHRDEILGQALATYRAIRPHDSLGRYTGGEKSPNATVLFASIQTLSRQTHLGLFARDEFDYIVVDEFHHAEAQTYRRLIEYFTPKFLLGLTATPERTDGADLLSLCENNLAYRCDLMEGIGHSLLCPFRYFGVPDSVDYRNIPWRNKKFDEDALTQAVATQVRAANALEHYRKWGGHRTLAFCASQRHADFMAAFFLANGIPAKSVHSGPTSAPRAESLEALEEGSLAVICAVDLFNEGVDLPELDTVMMLRPTESRIIWLQQFGRGLRRSSPAKRLTVIDYIGNHRSFLLKPQALFGLSPGDREIAELLNRLDSRTAKLPPGCEVTYELEAKNILRQLLRPAGSAVELLTRRYQDFRDTLGVRPTAAELSREGYNPRDVRPTFGSWLGFVKSQGGLSKDDEIAYAQAQSFLDVLETTEMSKSYKMLVLLAMLNRAQLPGAVPLVELADEIADLAHRDPRIGADLGHALDNPKALQKLLKDNPIDAWVGGKGTGGKSYFSYDQGTLSVTLSVSSTLTPVAQELVREIVDWRLTEYFGRQEQGPSTQLTLKVIQSGGNRPILLLPDRQQHPELPNGWTDVYMNDETVSANFVKTAVNVVQRAHSNENILPEILQRWFGPNAGEPGTRQTVLLSPHGNRWLLTPQGASSGNIVPYKAYRRQEIAPLFGLPYSQRYWEQGFVRQGNLTFLFVTLDKSDHTTAFQYKDHFLSAGQFQWQSQNRTSQDSDSGRSIRTHKTLGITIHLFVRAKAKTADGRGAAFYYCGPVEFHDWHGDKPITVIWNLTAPVPTPLWKELGIHKG